MNRTFGETMRIGDYVEYSSQWTKHNQWMKFPRLTGIIIELGQWAGNNDCIVLMDSDGQIHKANTKNLKLVYHG